MQCTLEYCFVRGGGEGDVAPQQYLLNCKVEWSVGFECCFVRGGGEGDVAPQPHRINTFLKYIFLENNREGNSEGKIKESKSSKIQKM